MPVGYSEPYEKQEFVLHVAYEGFVAFMRLQNFWGHPDLHKLEHGVRRRLETAVDEVVSGGMPKPVWEGDWHQDAAWLLFVRLAREASSLVSYVPKK